MLDSADFYVRHHAARVLAERSDPESRAQLQHALSSANTPTRASAARHLHRLSWFSAEALIRRALCDEDERVREAAVYALCEMHHLPAYDLLADVLAHETDNVRAAAAWGLRNTQDSAAVRALAMVLRADDPEVRGKALEALSANATPEALPLVCAALDDPHPDVVYNAVLSWIELRQEHCLPDLAARIKAGSGPEREPLLRGLFHATNYLHVDLAALPVAETLIDALAAALTGDHAPARMAAVWTLAWMHHPRAAQAIREAIAAEPDDEVRAHLVRVASSLAEYDPADVAAQPLTRAELAGQVSRPPRKKKKRK